MKLVHWPINMPDCPAQWNEYAGFGWKIKLRLPTREGCYVTEADARVKYSIYFLINPLFAWQNPPQWQMMQVGRLTNYIIGTWLNFSHQLMQIFLADKSVGIFGQEMLHAWSAIFKNCFQIFWEVLLEGHIINVNKDSTNSFLANAPEKRLQSVFQNFQT